MSMAAKNEELVRRWFNEVWNLRQEAIIDELLTAESVCFAEDGPMVGPSQFRQRMQIPFLSAFPDLRVIVDDVIADESKAVVRWTATATHRGRGIAIPPTGRSVSFQGVTWIQIADGKFMKAWQFSDIPEKIASLTK
jgi:steroid delta-isomerase-like uncharacterized protein